MRLIRAPNSLEHFIKPDVTRSMTVVALPMYDFYHLLNHLNLFGRSYLSGVRTVLQTI